MIRKEDVSKMFEFDSELEIIFIAICRYSILKKQGPLGTIWEIKPFCLGEIIQYISSEILKDRSSEIVTDHIEFLIKKGLIRYSNEEIRTGENESVDSGKETGGTTIMATKKLEEKFAQVTKESDGGGYSGIQYYVDYLRTLEGSKSEEEFAENLAAIMNRMQRPFQEEMEVLSNRVKQLKDYVDKTTHESLIKNIEIISLFTAVITILITNVFGFVGSQPIDIKKIIALNFSIIFALILLLTFTHTMILDRKLDKKTLFFLIIALVELATVIVVFMYI